MKSRTIALRAVKPRLIYGPMTRKISPLRVALLGHPKSGKKSIFQAVASTLVKTGQITNGQDTYQECTVQVGPNEIRLVNLPALRSFHHMESADLETIKYLLWGLNQPPIAQHELREPPIPLDRPDIVILVLDAAALEREMELAIEMSALGLPMVIALNRMDVARQTGFHIDVKKLTKILGIPIVPIVALKGHGLNRLFNTVVRTAQKKSCMIPQAATQHIRQWENRLASELLNTEVQTAFQVPIGFLTNRLLEGNDYFIAELDAHFPEQKLILDGINREANAKLPRPLSKEVAADRYHRAVSIFEQVVTVLTGKRKSTFEDKLDTIFLDPYGGIVSSLFMFALVLFVVFEISTAVDQISAAKLAQWVSTWNPTSLFGIIGRAIVDGLVGLIGIVVPYMLPLVLLLVVLEDSGIMPRIAFVADRFFHHLGLHGKVAVPFLLGLGCNVPAISATKSLPSRRDRVVASILITFVPCSARSAVILALGGKYLGGLGVFAIFFLNLTVIAIMSHVLTRRYPQTSPGLIQEIPPYSWPKWKNVFATTWNRTRDIITIVMPLLVGGSIVLALLSYIGADVWINTLLSPITLWLLGLPILLGVPLLFGILRKELSLLMIYQALGTFAVGEVLTNIQITTFLVFLTFYIPCVSTFAVMTKVIGSRDALYSIALSMGIALLAAVVIRALLEFGTMILPG